jgi:hypothetical protein
MPSQTTLAIYQADLQRILHDTGSNFYSQADQVRAINLGRRKVAEDTGCLRLLQQIYLTPNQEAYLFGAVTGTQVIAGGSGYTAPTVTFSSPTSGGTTATGVAVLNGGAISSITVTNAGSYYETAPTVTIADSTGTGASVVAGAISFQTIDILNVNPLYTTTRYGLMWAEWSQFSARWRYWTNWQQFPGAFSVYGQNTLYIAPLPDQVYPAELDSVVYPDDLISNSQYDPINLQYQEPVQYYAAGYLKYKEQSFGESKIFMDMYLQRVKETIVASATRRVPDPYDDASYYGPLGIP